MERCFGLNLRLRVHVPHEDTALSYQNDVIGAFGAGFESANRGVIVLLVVAETRVGRLMGWFGACLAVRLKSGNARR